MSQHRRKQNRESQRTFRQRKEVERIELQERLETAVKACEDLKKQVKRLEEENSSLRRSSQDSWAMRWWGEGCERRMYWNCSRMEAFWLAFLRIRSAGWIHFWVMVFLRHACLLWEAKCDASLIGCEVVPCWDSHMYVWVDIFDRWGLKCRIHVVILTNKGLRLKPYFF